MKIKLRGVMNLKKDNANFSKEKRESHLKVRQLSRNIE